MLRGKPWHRDSYSRIGVSNMLERIAFPSFRPDGLKRMGREPVRQAHVLKPLADDTLTLRFGMASYTEILTRDPVVPLTDEQKRVLEGVEAMGKATDLSGLSGFLKLLSSPEYKHIVNIICRDTNQHYIKGLLMYRQKFHSPFTEYYLALRQNVGLQDGLVGALSQLIKKPINTLSDEETMKNGVQALVDIYFYALRPSGKAFDLPLTRGGHKIVMLQRRKILTLFANLLLDPALPVASRRTLRNELLYGLRDVNRLFKPQVRRYTQLETQPLINTPVPEYPLTQTVPVAQSNQLKAAIRAGDVPAIREMLASGELQAMVPEWTRIAGPDNYQHFDQDYTLDNHLLGAMKAVQASKYYQVLTPEEKFRVSVAAFFHDISKRTGPKDFRDRGRVAPDPHHPERSAETVHRILPSLSFTPDEIRDVETLVEYHQELGDLAKPYGDKPTRERLMQTIERLGTVSRLKMLKALTEGDIRCVKFDVPGRTWFDADLANRLDYFANRIQVMMESRNQS